MNDLVAETGVVTQLQGDRAAVALTPTEACEDCSLRVFCRPGKDGARTIQARNTVDAHLGQRVAVSEIGLLGLKLAVMHYGVPLLGLLGGIFLVYATDLNLSPIRSEIIMSAAGLVGLLLGGCLTWFWSKTMAARMTCAFEITAILP
jgi:positive regulator of sigma E activity